MKKAAFLCVTVIAIAGMARCDNVEKTLEINSILADAQSIYLTPAAPARAGRLVALSGYLASLEPTDIYSLRFLCEVYTSRGLFADAKKYAAGLFDAQPDSYEAACRWLKFEIDERQTAPARIELLSSIANSQKYAPEFRAHAETRIAGLYNAQGDTKKAMDSISHALQLDPTSVEALLTNLSMTADPSNELKVKTVLEMLRGNPRNWTAARDLAVLLNELGLPELSAKYYSLAWAIVSNNKSELQMSPELLVGYLNALLSESKPDKVISLLSTRLKEFKEAPVIQELYVEALKASGVQPAAILTVLDQLKNSYKSLINQVAAKANLNPIIDRGRKTSPELADAIMQLGIFYLTTAENPGLAAEEFARAKDFGAKGDVLDMLQAAVAIEKNDAAAVQTLTKLAADFPYANFLLAKYYAKKSDAQKEKLYLTQGLKMGWGTRVSRALKKLWTFPEPQPKAAGFDKVAAVVNGFDAQVLYMATHPQDFVKVTLESAGAPIVSPGDPIRVTVTITNTGQLPISFGASGMLSTQVALGVTAPGKTEMKFYTAPIVSLPANRYLKPGKSISGTVRVDTAQISWYLASNPLSTVKLNIKACVNPIWNSDGYVLSEIPMIKPGEMTFYRAGLLATGKLTSAGVPQVRVTADWYNRVLGAMNDTLASDNVQDRFRTARQIAELIAYFRAIEGGLSALPQELRTVFKMAPIMALAEKVLQDKSPVVRSEFVAAMCNISTVTPEIINLVGPIFQDPSALVRLRLAEFLGNVGGKGNMEILQMFAADKNEFVSTMANAYLFYEKNRQKKPQPSSGQ